MTARTSARTAVTLLTLSAPWVVQDLRAAGADLMVRSVIGDPLGALAAQRLDLGARGHRGTAAGPGFPAQSGQGYETTGG